MLFDFDFLNNCKHAFAKNYVFFVIVLSTINHTQEI